MAWETKNVHTQPQFEDSFNGALQLVQTGKNELAYDAQTMRLQLRRAGRSPVDFACFSDRGMKNALQDCSEIEERNIKRGKSSLF